MEINSIKIECQKCGFSVTYPIKTNYTITPNCPACKTTFPAYHVGQIIKEINALKDELSGNNEIKNASVLIETQVE
jgi:hypothetical protein